MNFGARDKSVREKDLCDRRARELIVVLFLSNMHLSALNCTRYDKPRSFELHISNVNGSKPVLYIECIFNSGLDMEIQMV